MNHYSKALNKRRLSERLFVPSSLQDQSETAGVIRNRDFSMTSSKGKRFWKIKIYDGTSLLFQRKVLYGQITESSMINLLRVLVAKHSLNEDEIIEGFAKKRTKIHSELLEVKRLNGGPYGFTCGDSPYAIAVVENAL